MSLNLLLDINQDVIMYELIEDGKLIKIGYEKFKVNSNPITVSELLIRKFNDVLPQRIFFPGGILKPCCNDYIIVNENMYNDANKNLYGRSTYNYLTVVVYHIAKKFKVLAIAVKPLSLDNIGPLNRIKGIKNIRKYSRFHTCRHHDACLYAGKILRKNYDDVNIIVAYIGNKTSVGAYFKGKCIDVNDAYGAEGPMGFTSSGDVPIQQLVEMIIEEKYEISTIEKLLFSQSGLYGYKVKNAITADNLYNKHTNIKIAIDALGYQVSKHIGNRAISLNGRVDAIVICGEGAKSKKIVTNIKNRVEFIGQVFIYCQFDMFNYLRYISEIAGTNLYPIINY